MQTAVTAGQATSNCKVGGIILAFTILRSMLGTAMTVIASQSISGESGWITFVDILTVTVDGGLEANGGTGK